MIEWGIGLLVSGLLVLSIPAISNLIIQFTGFEFEGLAITSIIAILCGLFFLVYGGLSRKKER